MRIINFIFLVSVFLLLSCNKERATLEAIKGKWNIQKLYLIDHEGFKTITIPTGEIEFIVDSKYSNTGQYKINLSFVIDTTTSLLIQAGNFTQTNITDFTFKRENAHDFTAVVQYYTKNDLQFEIPNLDHTGYYFILNR